MIVTSPFVTAEPKKNVTPSHEITPGQKVNPDNGSAPAHKKSGMADYETFIKLLIAQMRNQDPTNPADPTKYVSQLASFSAVEQSMQTNKILTASSQKLEALVMSNAVSQAAGYIGKHIISADGEKQGIIKSVKIFPDGLEAKLDNGETVQIIPGVIVGDADKNADPAKPSDNSKPSEA